MKENILPAMSIGLSLVCGLTAVLCSTAAQAGTRATTFAVSVRVIDECTIETGPSTVGVDCTSGTAYALSLDSSTSDAINRPAPQLGGMGDGTMRIVTVAPSDSSGSRAPVIATICY